MDSSHWRLPSFIDEMLSKILRGRGNNLQQHPIDENLGIKLVRRARSVRRHSKWLLVLLFVSLAYGFGMTGIDGHTINLNALTSQEAGTSMLHGWNEHSPLNWTVNNVSQSEIIQAMARVARSDPPAAVNESCLPPILEPVPSCLGQPVFTGKTLNATRRILQMIMVSFESDTLEIALRESYDVVDYIFIVESTRIHLSKGPDARGSKPLLWESVRYSERFSFLPKDKLIYIVVDDVDIQEALNADERDIWSVELLQTVIGVNKVKQWVERTRNQIRDDDVFISSNVDEVISREVLHSMRWCELGDTMFTGALWMPMGNLGFAFQTDHHAASLPYTISIPTMFNWNLIASGEEDGRRQYAMDMAKKRGPEWKFVKGGAHLTNPSFVAYQLIKSLTCTECDGEVDLDGYTFERIEQDQMSFYSLDKTPDWKKRTIDIKDLPETYSGWLTYTPWFLSCNQERFPYWYGKLDSRNKILWYTLKKLSLGSPYSIDCMLHSPDPGKC